MQPVIGLVGVGNWGRLILRDLVALGCDVHVVANTEQSVANAREFGATAIVGSVAELPELDGAVCASIATSHAEVVLALAEATPGPIYCEKPLTADVAQADQLVETLGDRLFVMDKWRYQAGVLGLARLAQNGELGAIQSISLRRVSTGNPHPDVNTIWTHMPHDLSIALEILGEIPPVTQAVGEFVNGKIVGTRAILGESPWVAIEVSDGAPEHHRELRVVGSTGVAILAGGWSEEVIVRRFDGADDQVIAAKGELPLLAELRAFIEHVQGGPPPKSSAADGALIVRRIEETLEEASNECV
ncbi:MAG: Gfo/Idh/MocA family oxidoreductase [Thermoleophilaceae bacterium]|nr:Gfo/Idh/MocA family oxidoreductase [Thermoleophilaceae bacterium]